MRIKQLFLILALLLTAVTQGAWADEWDVVYWQTQTKQSDWTALSAGSTDGRVLGASGTATYYYVNRNLSFTNSTAGGSGLTIQGTVYLYVPEGMTLTCAGADASGQTGGGAGIELTLGNSLYLIGGGTLNATGGKAANGGNGGKGVDSGGTWDESTSTGSGGSGGYGGGGAGAGIGTHGGNGGNGGAGGSGYTYTDWKAHNGTDGISGSAGSTVGAMGALYVYQATGTTVNATGGTAGSTGGSGGGRGRGRIDDEGYNYSVSGGGGGGGGGFGGAASNIGTGGPGGGGGGGGAGGAQDWKSSGYYDVTAYGGHGGQNANGTFAADGAEALTSRLAMEAGLVDTNYDGWDDDDADPPSGAATFGNGGAGGAAGSASVGGSYGTVTLDWTKQEDDWSLICLRTGTTRADWVHLASGSSMGKTLGAAGTTTYYYTAFDRTFTNSNAGGSGLTILGTVYLYIPSGKTITCTGAHASGTTGAGAGIELTEGNTLYLIGRGSLVATGGNATNGTNGTNGGNAYFNTQTWVRSGDGGRGGNGGGGGGAGIGTRGGTGGTGGAGGAGKQEDYNETTGNVGSNGQNGGTAAAMGTLYIYDGSQALTPQTAIQGGSQGTSGGNGGAGGTDTIEYHGVYFWTAGGGGGGAGGGFGGAASNIGTGGPGGGGGGGGASGSIASRDGSYKTFYQVGAFGGNPGANADGTPAGNGANTLMTTCTVEFTTGGDYDNSFVPTTAGWQNGDNRAAGGNGGGRGAASVSGSANAVTAGWPTQGKGIEDAPFIVSSTDDWNEFADYVNSGYAFSGNFVKLGDDVSVSTMAGTDDAHSFQGTFNGDSHTMTFTKGTSAEPFAEEYCAPFRHVKNATIKNLHVAGTIYTSAKKAAGFVGESHGALTLTGCISSVNINSSIKGDGTHGGLVSTLSGSGNDITIEGCVFDGSFATTNGTNNCGGFIGWGVYNKPAIKNSLMKPGSVPASMLINTFARWYTGDGGIYEPTVTNCYYVATDNLPTDQGKQTHTISAGEYVTISGLGAATTTYDVSGITSYAKGIKYNSVYYAGNGENVSLTLSHGDKDGYIFRNYTASAGTLNGTTLTMPDTDVTINAEWMEFLLTGTGTSEDPYSIDNAEQWNNFADAVSIGYTFSGQYVKLNEDISVTEMVGTGENNSFQGIFLGNGKTLTFNKTISQNYYYSAPFRYVNGATIQDLKVKGDIYTYGYYTGGLVACCYGTTNIINCRIGSVIHNWGDDDSSYYYHSGFVAKHWSGALTITGCAFTGCLLTKDIYANMSGFVAYSQGTSLTITNSLFDPNLNVPMPYGQSVNRDRVFVLWSKNVPVTVTNSYYAYRPELGEPLGTRVYAIIPGDFVTVANAGAVSNAYADSELTFYTTGIQCGDAFYAANGQNVSLTLGSQPNCQVTAFAASAGTLAGSGNPYTLTMPEQNVTIGATNVTVDNLQGGGTSENPYTISSADDWRIFSLNVANNNTYNGEYVKLMANISVSEMVGTSEGNSFKGTFLGNNKTLTFTKGSIENVFSEEQCAPFRYVNGATIQDLKVTGAIYTSKRHAGGLIAHCYNTTYITNCHVSTIIYNDCGDNNGRVRHGGIVGLLNDDSNAKLYIQGCSYTGRLLTDRNIEWCGGFVSGLNYYSHAYITNSLYAPGSIPSGWSTSIINSRTFNCGDGDITNCYHTETMGLIQGTRVLAFATAPANLGSVVHEYSMMTVYDNGILYDGTYYVTPTLPGSGTEQAPYTISSNEEWDLFANIVNDGFNNYNDKFVRLDESISVSTMVGTSDDRSFQGTFLGNNKTLTFTKGTSGSAFGEEYCAPFRYVKNATIQDLKVAGDIYTSRKFAAGLIAQPSGTTNITNCIVSTVIHSNVSGDGTHGGIVARLGSNTTEINITGCVFNGRLLTNNGTHSCGGFVGWWDNKTANISNSLYAPDANITPGAGETAITDGATIIRDNNSAAYATCYFTETLGVAQGKQAYAFDSAPANLGSLVQNYGMVKAYANGILFDGTYYVAPASISLTDNSNNSTDISNADGYVANVTLTGRTLYKDGKWNTLCLPFNLVLAGSPLAGATARPLTSASISGSTLNLSFGTAVTTLVAGTPYIIKWEKASGYDEASEETRDLKAPAFSGVTISSDLHPYDNGEEKGDDRVRFLGTYESKTFGTTDNTILLMGAANTLYYPQSGAGIGAQRAYFKIGEDGVQARPLTAFSIDFGDGENNATGIVEADSSFFTLHSSFKGTWYDIQGRRIEGKPTQHGVYINNGRKVVIK